MSYIRYRRKENNNANQQKITVRRTPSYSHGFFFFFFFSPRNPFFQINVLVIISATVAVSVPFLGYGIRLLVVASKHIRSQRRRCRYYLKVVMTITFLVTCFLVKFAFLLYRPITGEYMNTWLFFFAEYYLPESLSVLLIVVIIIVSKRSSVLFTITFGELSWEDESILDNQV